MPLVVLQYKFLEADLEWRPTQLPDTTTKGQWTPCPDVIYQVIPGNSTTHAHLQVAPRVIKGEPALPSLKKKILDCARNGIFKKYWSPTDTTQWETYFLQAIPSLTNWLISSAPSISSPAPPPAGTTDGCRTVVGESIVCSDPVAARAWLESRTIARKEVRGIWTCINILMCWLCRPNNLALWQLLYNAHTGNENDKTSTMEPPSWNILRSLLR